MLGNETNLNKFERIKIVDLKQIDCQLFLQQNRVSLGSIKNGTSGSAIMVSHGASPQRAREGDIFYRGEKEVMRGLQ